MNYYSDHPIKNCDQDLLGRASFSKQLGRMIYEYNCSDGLVIGLYGKWGTGKTSVINMAISEIDRLSSKKEKKPLTMRFQPWNYADKDNLISIFFQSLKNTIEIQDNEEIKLRIGKVLADYAGALDALSLVPIFGSGLATVLKTVAQVQGEALMKGIDLERTKEALEKALLETKQKIIVVIDDIDRLTNSQIRDIFQLVKQVADFPNVVYVLSMDREVVKNALANTQGFDGNDYLEKIIQVPFELPELRRTKLRDILFAKLEQIIQGLPSEIIWDQQYWNSVFHNCIEPYINTIRDVNRVINTFQFRYGMLYEETSFEDMIGITTIEVLEPELYKWIRNNKDSVCGGLFHNFLSTRGQKTDYRKQYADEFSILGIDPDKSIKCVSTLFPVFAKDVDEYYVGYQTDSEIRGKMRVAHEERFELYFMFDLDDIKVPRRIINSCINDLDSDEFQTIIEEINNQGSIVFFLEEISSLINEIPYDRLGLFISVFLQIQDSFRGESVKTFFSISARELAENCVLKMLQRLSTEDERYDIIYSFAIHAPKQGLGVLARIINRIESSYGRLGEKSENKKNQIINLEQLKNLEDLYINRVKSIVASESLLDLSDFSYIIYLWELFDEESVHQYLSCLLEDDVQKLKYMCAIATRWQGTNGSGWGFYTKQYSSYISDEEVYNLILDYDKNKLDIFSDDEQIKLASFVLNYHKDEMDHVNEDEAKILLKEWKAKQTIIHSK